MKTRYLIACLLTVLLSGCAVKPVLPVREAPPAPLVKLAEGEAPRLDDDLDLASLDVAVGRSLAFLDKNSGAGFRFGDVIYTAADVRESLLAFREIIRSSDPTELKMKRIGASFDIYKALGTDGAGAVVFTGYYEPVLNGSLTETERFRYPLYKPPPDLMAATRGAASPPAYLSRAEIDGKKALADRGLEIAWVDDPVALFSLHIQGSGMIRLPDGRVIQVSFARSNGRPFRGIGKHMVEKGILSRQDLSDQTIKTYLRNHPDEQADIFNHNERYIFFRVVDNGPVGALGVTVTGGRTIAIDPGIYPNGAISFIRLRKPVFSENGGRNGWVPFSRFVLAQDAGAAIKGPGRIDLFCGGGDDAERIAGSLKEKGELYFLMKKKTTDSR
jgi:membrane-bound lytic murein transglycosylase A